jgi:hypothetical protein
VRWRSVRWPDFRRGSQCGRLVADEPMGSPTGRYVVGTLFRCGFVHFLPCVSAFRQWLGRNRPIALSLPQGWMPALPTVAASIIYSPANPWNGELYDQKARSAVARNRCPTEDCSSALSAKLCARPSRRCTATWPKVRHQGCRSLENYRSSKASPATSSTASRSTLHCNMRRAPARVSHLRLWAFAARQSYLRLGNEPELHPHKRQQMESVN